MSENSYCKACGGNLADSAKFCSGCGASVSNFGGHDTRQEANPTGIKATLRGIGDRQIERRTIAKSGTVMVVVILFAIIVSIAWPSGNSYRPPPDTPEQIAAKKAAEEERAKDMLRGKSKFVAAMMLRQAMRNPESLVIKEAWSNDSGSVICILYRAQNGFGGRNVENAVAMGGLVSTGVSASRYNKLCTDATHEQTWNARTVAKVSLGE